MNKGWDSDKGGRDQWILWMGDIAKECNRVLKPGGHALVWALPRTSHWTGMAWENGGFEVRDKVAHIFGTGFPKSMDISKSIDAHFGKTRTVKKGVKPGHEEFVNRTTKGHLEGVDGEKAWKRPWMESENASDYHYDFEPATDESKQWTGWGTNLKPAMEDWWLLRKPISEKTIAENVLKYGTGGINIDESRIPINPEVDDPRLGGNGTWKTDGMAKNVYAGGYSGKENGSSVLGRFPSNIIHDGSDEVISLFPESKGQQGDVKGSEPSHTGQNGIYGEYGRVESQKRNDSGSAARFFYCAKASQSDRNEGLEDFEEKSIGRKGNGIRRICATCGVQSLEAHLCKCDEKNWINPPTKKNNHPTVKNTELMKYLVRMITPPNGTVLDPFMGSGSTGKAAVRCGFSFVGIELEKEYFDIAKARIEYARDNPEKTKKQKKKKENIKDLPSDLFE
jgi:site-specific DNA-methyltransferase (adenine-specific)